MVITLAASLVLAATSQPAFGAPAAALMASGGEVEVFDVFEWRMVVAGSGSSPPSRKLGELGVRAQHASLRGTSAKALGEYLLGLTYSVPPRNSISLCGPFNPTVAFKFLGAEGDWVTVFLSFWCSRVGVLRPGQKVVTLYDVRLNNEVAAVVWSAHPQAKLMIAKPDRVDPPDAAGLPVELIVAALKADREGSEVVPLPALSLRPEQMVGPILKALGRRVEISHGQVMLCRVLDLVSDEILRAHFEATESEVERFGLVRYLVFHASRLDGASFRALQDRLLALAHLRGDADTRIHALTAVTTSRKLEPRVLQMLEQLRKGGLPVWSPEPTKQWPSSRIAAVTELARVRSCPEAWPDTTDPMDVMSLELARAWCQTQHPIPRDVFVHDSPFVQRHACSLIQVRSRRVEYEVLRNALRAPEKSTASRAHQCVEQLAGQPFRTVDLADAWLDIRVTP
jgi:hypothetical protein